MTDEQKILMERLTLLSDNDTIKWWQTFEDKNVYKSHFEDSSSGIEFVIVKGAYKKFPAYTLLVTSESKKLITRIWWTSCWEYCDYEFEPQTIEERELALANRKLYRGFFYKFEDALNANMHRNKMSTQHSIDSVNLILYNLLNKQK